MKYYKLALDMERKNDFGIRQNTFNVGKFYEGWDC